MKKFFGIFLLLILLSGCKDIYRVKTIGIDEELYIKGISRVPGGRASYPYMKYYVGTLLGRDTLFVIIGNYIKDKDSLEYKLGDRITIRKVNE